MRGASLKQQTVDIAAHVIDPKNYEFVVPKKEISNADHIATKWTVSEAYRDLLGFIHAMNSAVKNVKISDPCQVSEVTKGLMSMLAKLDVWVDEIAPIEQPQRFGNKAFRSWSEKMNENADDLLRGALPDNFHPAVVEIKAYLTDSFGNSTRIDYGTGHEMAFVSFLCCLYKIGALTEQDAVATVTMVFDKYMELSQKLQKTYNMEPAGSQGVWSLDDYQFIPFIWGSSQLLDHQRLKPKSFPDPEISQSYAKDYIFLKCIVHINKMKTGPFSEHSNQLWNISGVPLWSKVNSGLIKMYKAEVLSKFPVIQHFLFGSLLSIKQA